LPQIVRRREYPERHGCNLLADELVVAWIAHSDDEVEIALGETLLLYRRNDFEIDPAPAVAELLHPRKQPVFCKAFSRRDPDHRRALSDPRTKIALKGFEGLQQIRRRSLQMLALLRKLHPRRRAKKQRCVDVPL